MTGSLHSQSAKVIQLPNCSKECWEIRPENPQVSDESLCGRDREHRPSCPVRRWDSCNSDHPAVLLGLHLQDVQRAGVQEPQGGSVGRGLAWAEARGMHELLRERVRRRGAVTRDASHGQGVGTGLPRPLMPY